MGRNLIRFNLLILSIIYVNTASAQVLGLDTIVIPQETNFVSEGGIVNNKEQNTISLHAITNRNAGSREQTVKDLLNGDLPTNPSSSGSQKAY